MVNFAHMSVIVLSVLQFGIFHFQFQFFIGIFSGIKQAVLKKAHRDRVNKG